jgi:hypothetical protein
MLCFFLICLIDALCGCQVLFVVSQCIINYYETAGHKLVDSALWLVISQELPIMGLMYLVRTAHCRTHCRTRS